MKLAIIDDEPINRLVLNKIITANCSYATIALEDGIIESSVKKINELRPDVVLLDVEMKNGTGFDVIKGLNYMPLFIFVTAYEKYALQAIKNQASDYILKPINEEELLSALSRCRKKLMAAQPAEVQSFFTYSTNDEKKSISTDDILYFEGSGAYVYCISVKEKILLSKNIGEVEKNLDEKNFIRCHQSYIVNIKYVTSFNQKRNGNMILSNGSEIPVSQRKMKAVAGLLNKSTN